MKFNCPRCDKKYSVPDEKLPPGKVLKVTCKKCNEAIRVRTPTPASETLKPTLQALEDVGASQMTRVASLAEINAVKDASKKAASESSPAGAKPAAAWFVLIAGKQEGPMPEGQLRNSFNRHEINIRTYVWREGMAQWQRIQDVAALQDLVPSTPGNEGLPLPGAFAGTAGAEPDAGYVEAEPGDATRVFMNTAGIYKRRRNQRIAAALTGLTVLLFVGIIALDVLGIWQIPGMGLVYDIAGMADPNIGRARERVESQLADTSLDPSERAHLRAKLLGLQPDAVNAPAPAPKPAVAPAAAVVPTPAAIVEKAAPTTVEPSAAALSPNDRSMANNVFNDTRKKENGLSLEDASVIRAEKLPAGLTQEAIFAVIKENNRSMSLCYNEALRKGEHLTGKMEVQVTIAPNGTVSESSIETANFKNSTLGTCTLKRIKTWKFPQFSGEPVAVVFPYVLTSGL